MLHHDRVYMLAADHRWQWEEWCDARGLARERIADAKRLAFDAFMLAREASPDVRDHGALLLDAQYSSPIVAEAARAGIDVGTPAEKAGAFPLAWAAEPFDRALAGAFVKVLVRYRSDDEPSIHDEQRRKLLELHAWCRAAGKPLVVEILVGRRGEPEDEFEASGRPAMLARFVHEAYDRGLVPEFWKIEGTLSAHGARVIDDAIGAQAGGRQIILGKAADLGTIDRWFAVAAKTATAAGFAIGRSVFWDPSVAYLSGGTTAAAARDRIADNYLRLVGAWRMHGSGPTDAKL
ncbi:MAG: hypothetical protein DMF93_17660 [Acidobacteria bacterium]|nr:MAG: hypothetical protein DMF93_17660 [Acidobacteriota bacterium]